MTAPFLTIARQVGIGLPSLPASVASRLSTAPSASWTVWDKEIVAKAAAEYGIPVSTIERVEESGYSWLDMFISGLAGTPDDFAVVHRIRDVVQGLAKRGQVVLVGHGAAFMTSDMPGGTHIRLVAPRQHRVESVARNLRMSATDATVRLKDAERKWTAYLRRYWPTKTLAPESFAATFNTAALDEEHLVRCIVTAAT